MNAEQSSIINILILLLIILTSIRLIKYLNNLDEVCGVVEKFNEEIKENGMVKEKVKTVFGTPTKWDIKNFESSYKNTSENAPVVMGDEKSLSLFKYNDCKAECCEFGKGTDYSCSRGCVCYNKEQNNLIASRGDGVFPQESKNELKYKPYQKIINDKY